MFVGCGPARDAERALAWCHWPLRHSQGKLDTLDLKVHSDAGHIPGIAVTLAEMGTTQADLVFNWTGGITASTDCFVTHKAAITAMRAPGSMQVKTRHRTHTHTHYRR